MRTKTAVQMRQWRAAWPGLAWPGPHLMVFLLQDEDDVSRLHARCLVCFAPKGDLLPVLHAFVHVHLQNLHLLHHFFALTFFTAILLANNFPCRETTRHGIAKEKELV